MSDPSTDNRRWFTLVDRGPDVVWVEGPFLTQTEAQDHGLLVCGRGKHYHCRAVRLEKPETEEIIARLAGWIETNCEGVQVYADTGMVVT